MTNDELKSATDWMAASKAGDIPAVLSLMTEDVIFMVPANRPSESKPSPRPPKA
jgi:ketosteroid isomerase-like protein